MESSHAVAFLEFNDVLADFVDDAGNVVALEESPSACLLQSTMQYK
jgi:hypothetical protein